VFEVARPRISVIGASDILHAAASDLLQCVTQPFQRLERKGQLHHHAEGGVGWPAGCEYELMMPVWSSAEKYKLARKQFGNAPIRHEQAQGPRIKGFHPR